MNTSCENNNKQSTFGCACHQPWQPINQQGCGLGNGGCQTMNNQGMNMVMPIVMPTQVVARQAFSFVEQPVIMPIECRTINRAVMVPRFYPSYTHTSVNCCC